MENEIALIATGYVLARIAALAAFGYLIYRLLRSAPSKEPVRSRSRHAKERLGATRPRG